MKLTPEEKKICNQYSKEDDNKVIHCFECPLALHEYSYDYGRCKATMTKREWIAAQKIVDFSEYKKHRK